jgi:hypothetical protein
MWGNAEGLAERGYWISQTHLLSKTLALSLTF